MSFLIASPALPRTLISNESMSISRIGHVLEILNFKIKHSFVVSISTLEKAISVLHERDHYFMPFCFLTDNDEQMLMIYNRDDDTFIISKGKYGCTISRLALADLLLKVD